MTRDTEPPDGDASASPDHFVREWREFMGWSQEELAEMANVHHTTIGRIETGKRKLKTRFLRDLAKLFGVPASAIMDINPATESGAKTARMLLAWERLSQSQRDDILKMVTALAGLDAKKDAS
ncbi:MAG: helix-turn-helix transcriptional regulator [Hyphomonadaceae bacterium]